MGEQVDLSRHSEADGVPTVFTWYNSAGGPIPSTDYSAVDGVFTFDESLVGETIYCEMTNEKVPGLVLKTVKALYGTHRITFIKPTEANDESDPVNINSGSLMIARIDGPIDAVKSVTVSVDGGEEQDGALSGNTVYYLLPAGLASGEHTITVELTNTADQTISEEVTFYWDSYRRGFGFGRFDFGDAD